MSSHSYGHAWRANWANNTNQERKATQKQRSQIDFAIFVSFAHSFNWNDYDAWVESVEEFLILPTGEVFIQVCKYSHEILC